MTQIQRIKCGNGNAYLLLNGKKAVLIDTGRKKYREKVLDACKKYEVQLLILTHGHLDHIENAEYLVNELHIPIAICEDDMDLLETNMNQSLHAHTLLGRLVLALSVKTFSEELMPKIQPGVFLHEGDTLNAYGIDASIIRLPGHTNGSIGIVVNENSLIAGDALMNMFYPTVSMLYHKKDQMLQSAERISKMGPTCQIFFGHGKPISNKTW